MKPQRLPRDSARNGKGVISAAAAGAMGAIRAALAVRARTHRERDADRRFNPTRYLTDCQASFSVAIRLNTGAPGFESIASATK